MQRTWLSFLIAVVGGPVALPAWAGAPAEKATVRTERRSGDGRDTALIKTWKLKGGTMITAETLLSDGQKVGYSRTVTRLNKSSYCRGVDKGIRFTNVVGWLGGAHVVFGNRSDGNYTRSVVNPSGRTEVIFGGPLWGKERVIKTWSPRKR